MGAAEEAGSCHVTEVMGTDLFTLTPDTVVASARRLAFDHGISHLLVLDGGTLTGIVCEEDLRTAERDALVGELMRTPVLCIEPDTTLDEAAQIMEEQGVSCLPVVRGARLLGMVTRDALALLAGGPDPRATEPCVACGSSKDVRHDPRAARLALCADCLGKKLPSILRATAS